MDIYKIVDYAERSRGSSQYRHEEAALITPMTLEGGSLETQSDGPLRTQGIQVKTRREWVNASQSWTDTPISGEIRQASGRTEKTLLGTKKMSVESGQTVHQSSVFDLGGDLQSTTPEDQVFEGTKIQIGGAPIITAKNFRLKAFPVKSWTNTQSRSTGLSFGGPLLGPALGQGSGSLSDAVPMLNTLKQLGRGDLQDNAAILATAGIQGFQALSTLARATSLVSGASQVAGLSRVGIGTQWSSSSQRTQVQDPAVMQSKSGHANIKTAQDFGLEGGSKFRHEGPATINVGRNFNMTAGYNTTTATNRSGGSSLSTDLTNPVLGLGVSLQGGSTTAHRQTAQVPELTIMAPLELTVEGTSRVEGPVKVATIKAEFKGKVVVATPADTYELSGSSTGFTISLTPSFNMSSDSVSSQHHRISAGFMAGSGNINAPQGIDLGGVINGNITILGQVRAVHLPEWHEEEHICFGLSASPFEAIQALLNFNYSVKDKQGYMPTGVNVAPDQHVVTSDTGFHLRLVVPIVDKKLLDQDLKAIGNFLSGTRETLVQGGMAEKEATDLVENKEIQEIVFDLREMEQEISAAENRALKKIQNRKQLKEATKQTLRNKGKEKAPLHVPNLAESLFNEPAADYTDILEPLAQEKYAIIEKHQGVIAAKKKSFAEKSLDFVMGVNQVGADVIEGIVEELGEQKKALIKDPASYGRGVVIGAAETLTPGVGAYQEWKAGNYFTGSVYLGLDFAVPLIKGVGKIGAKGLAAIKARIANKMAVRAPKGAHPPAAKNVALHEKYKAELRANETHSPQNAALGEKHKVELREKMERPYAEDQRLAKLLENLHKDSSSVGSGSTAAAVRRERMTGEPVGGKFHTQKAVEGIKSIQTWLKNNPTASVRDRAAAENMLKDLQSLGETL